MKLPSLQQLAAEAARVVRRFPLTLLCAVVLCSVGIYTNHLNYQEKQHLDWLFPVLSAAGLGLSGTLAVALTAERYHWRLALRWGALAVVLGLLAVWYALAPAQPNTEWGARLALLLLGTHLAVAAGPYLPELRRQADTPGFWRYNETLFLRILTAGLYSGVLFAGCALALVAVENLFFVDIKPRVYADLFVVLGSIFNTWFFLAGVPRDFAALEQEVSYPKGLKVFTQFVLLPLVVLYLGILYAYLGRILLVQALPQGWVSMLVLALAVAGIFALLLIHPIRHAAENTWIRTFGRWFYLALFPLLGLLAVAIGTRIRTYGITEERYFVLVLAAWLFGIAIYFLRRRGQGIIWIPASLAVVAFLAAGGPWGAFAVARRSQLNQLREISTQYGLLKDGKLDGAGKRVSELPKEARKRISSIFDFFADREAVEKLQPFFATKLVLPDSLQNRFRWARTYQQTRQLYTISGLPEWNEYDQYSDEGGVHSGRRISFKPDNGSLWRLGDGRYLWTEVDTRHYQQPEREVVAEQFLPEGRFRFVSTGFGRQLHLEECMPSGDWHTQLVWHPGKLADSLSEKHSISNSDDIALSNTALNLQSQRGALSAQLLFSMLDREQHQDTVTYQYRAQVIMQLKRKLIR
ncbi:DUF4153 domain-containing protein [Hymenobacter endophyticus]|uniref:DUF4153 domain-containing protein n=1 Tax=Hymenobacter endophyticus TaxID=3076335 RepID=A0ABU3TMV4_9BACT|nr:DUF4153 domain-containing protein [Hymenobacter endophyticus]MDU0372718.1 DUF4153 domain-containing protein [Hymenobacter endophyticus]